MTEIDTKRLRELLASATPGPWVIDTNETYSIRDKDGGRFVLMTHLLGRNGEGGRRDAEEVAATLRLIVAMREALPALLHQLAERDAEVERLRISLGREQHEHNRTKDALAGATETWYDAETGTTWDVPTAWAYAQSCRAREEQRNRAEAAERARDEATGLLRGVVEMHTGENIDGCGMSNASLESIAALLAASGGKDHG